MIRLQWKDESISTTKLGLLKVLVEWEGGLYPKDSNLPTGYRVTVYGNGKRHLKNLFTNRDDAKIAAERLLWKIDKLENAVTYMFPTFSVTFDWYRLYEI